MSYITSDGYELKPENFQYKEWRHPFVVAIFNELTRSSPRRHSFATMVRALYELGIFYPPYASQPSDTKSIMHEAAAAYNVFNGITLDTANAQQLQMLLLANSYDTMQMLIPRYPELWDEIRRENPAWQFWDDSSMI